MSLLAIQDVPPKDEAFFLRKQNKPVLKQLLEIIVKLGVPRQKVPKRKHSKPFSYRVSVCVSQSHKLVLNRFSVNLASGAHQLVFTQLWLKNGAVGISELTGRLHQCLHFSAGEPHLYLADKKATNHQLLLRCFKKWQTKNHEKQVWHK